MVQGVQSAGAQEVSKCRGAEVVQGWCLRGDAVVEQVQRWCRGGAEVLT